MIPLRDTIVSRNMPLVTMGLILLNILIFIFQAGQAERIQEVVFTYGLVPARYFIPDLAAQFSMGQQVLSLVSFMFLHGGILHLLGNMWFLYIFGSSLEDALGSIMFLLFYLCCGILSGVAHLVMYPESTIPVIGASGAVAGVMGAYLVRFPRARILTVVPIVFIPYFIEVPAVVFLGLWFLFQFISAAFLDSQGGGIAWWAHVGGFLVGIVLFKGFMVTPGSRFGDYLRGMTQRRVSHRLHRVHEHDYRGNDCHGVIYITPHEALRGTRKLISIPGKIKKRAFVVSIPPGVRQGQVIRLAGIGKRLDDGSAGDCYLRVNLES